MNNNRTKNARDLPHLWGVAADTIGIAGFIFLIKEEIDKAIISLTLPQELNFYFLFFWAFVAAFFGGLFWNFLNRLNEKFAFMGESAYVGGTQSEPHGRAAAVWPLASIVPVVVVLISLNLIYPFTRIREQVLLYGMFLVGITLGSLCFYDLRLRGHRGFRNYLEARAKSSVQDSSRMELRLVVIWSTLLSVPGFLLLGGMKLLVTRGYISFWVLVWPFLKQISLCIGLTTLAVIFFLLAFPGQPRFDTARGIVAGIFLRISLFFGLLFA